MVKKLELANCDQWKLQAPCEHQWVALGSNEDYCWRRQCQRCGEIEGQRHTLAPAAYMVTGVCVYAYVCEGCGYVPE
ncbi:MAG: hypothetical protein JXA33_15825 [Anaerolineae bacterium]|nr:hypothetical protein [Anaerolineae bacterium]